MIVLINNSFP